MSLRACSSMVSEKRHYLSYIVFAYLAFGNERLPVLPPRHVRIGLALGAGQGQRTLLFRALQSAPHYRDDIGSYCRRCPYIRLLDSSELWYHGALKDVAKSSTKVRYLSAHPSGVLGQLAMTSKDLAALVYTTKKTTACRVPRFPIIAEASMHRGARCS